ncbi:mRNA degradation protein [Smittium culicis]|nr:mRNA degradation protein [Smittium culicis]
MKYTLKSINDDAHEKVPKLAHGLDKILINPGYHFLKNPKNGTYNYPPFLKSITQPEDFDYSKLTPFIKPSEDLTLQKHAENLKKKYVGSTSSMTGAMSQLYFLISNFKNADTLKFSSAFAGEGKSMEKMLVSEQNDYEKFIKASLVEPNDNLEESYIYSTFKDFLVRSQLDCKDQRLKKITFDLKTRAVVAVRMDVENYKETRGYQITKGAGLLQSFEREYYDLVRSAFLKYNFQTRIGHMDGVFVAYHNTASICGFQYISTKEMDRRLYGNSITGNYSFNSTLTLLNEILNTITAEIPDKNLILSFSANEPSQSLTLWVEGLSSTQNEILSANDSITTPENTETKKSKLTYPENPDLSENSDKVSLQDIEIEIDPNSDIRKYNIKVRTFINDELVNGEYMLNSNRDKAEYDWSITQELVREPHQDYKIFRNKQRTYFTRGRFKDKVPSFIKTLREISKRCQQNTNEN